MIIKTIYELEPDCYVENNEYCCVHLKYKNKNYTGFADISPEDIDFFSEKVGLRIAHSRAIIKILKDLKKQAKQIYDIKYQMYQEAINYGARPPAEVDPTGAFLRKVILAERNYRRIQRAIQKEEKYLNLYLQDQDKLVRSIKTKRELDEKK